MKRKNIIIVLFSFLLLMGAYSFSTDAFAYNGEIKSVELLCKDSAPVFMIEENTHGFIKEQDDEQFYYYYPPDIGEYYDIKVTYEDDTQAVYSALDDGYYNVNNKDDYLNSILQSEQTAKHPWTAGNSYSFWIECNGVKSENLYVEITENRVKTVSFERADGTTSYNRIEYTDGEYLSGLENMKDFFCYNLPSFSEGDKLTINGKTPYVYKEGSFVNSEDENDSIRAEMYALQSQSGETPWTSGNTYKLAVRCQGVSSNNYLDFTIVPIASIEFQRADNYKMPYRIIESMQDGVFGSYVIDEVTGEKYFRYYYPNFSNGDLLTITTEDGKKHKYFFTGAEAMYEGTGDDCGPTGFISSEDGDVLKADIQWKSTQSPDSVWFAGHEYPIWLEVCGKKSNQLGAVVIKNKNPVTAIEYHRATLPFEIVENTEGHWFYPSNDGEDEDEEPINTEPYYVYEAGFLPGDELIFISGSIRFVYTAQADSDGKFNNFFINQNDANDYIDVPKDGLWISSTQNRKNHWHVGNSYSFSVEWGGFKYEFPVSIIASSDNNGSTDDQKSEEQKSDGQTPDDQQSGDKTPDGQTPGDQQGGNKAPDSQIPDDGKSVEPIPSEAEPATIDPTKKHGIDGTALGKGASAEAADKKIRNLKSDSDPEGARFAPLMLKSTKQTRTGITIRWKKVKEAKKYVIYGNACGKKEKFKRIKTVSGSSSRIISIARKKLKKAKSYKFIVVALDEDNQVVSTSKVIHVCTKGKANYTKVTTTAKKNKVSLKKGKTFNLGAKAVGRKVSRHVGIRYESSNKKIATVTKAGKITGKKKGKCKIYVFAQNGICKIIKITIE